MRATTIRKATLFVSAVILFCLFSKNTQAQSQNKKFENGVYFLEHLPPGYDPGGSTLYPVLIFLHGLGERSDAGLNHTQNMAQLDRVKAVGPPFEMERGSNMCFTVPGQPQRCFIVLSPQRDKSGTAWETHTQKLIEYAQATYKIDPNRLYITGLSQGGIGTLDYIQGPSNRPWATQFAAAAVAAGGGADMGNACIMNQRNIEFWEVHGTSDPTVAFTPMLNFINAVLNCTPRPLTNLYAIPGAGHNVWRDFYHTGADASYVPSPDKRYSPNVYEWFLMNPKNGSNSSSNQAPVVNAGIDVTSTTPSFTRLGTASDYDGNVASLTMNWTQVSGPTTATISQSSITTTSTLSQRTINVSNMNSNGVYRFKLTSSDGSRTGEDIFEVTKVGASPTSCTGTGTITREQWNNVMGMTVSNIPVDQAPSSTGTLNLFEGPNNIGTSYGARIRGYLCPPVSGNYTFWIASDDQSELWISTNDNPANKVLRASVPSYTAPREWTKFSSQTSVVLSLTAGQVYYIEALHKEGSSADHIAVGWKLPNGTMERPIPGVRLMPFGQSSTPPITPPPPPPPNCSATGTISRDEWDNVLGTIVSVLPISLIPTKSSTLTIFEGPVNCGTSYGSRIRGYICPPVTGTYKFWIASDDQSELWISTNDNPSNKIMRASVPSYTAVREWTKFASQASVGISLVAGQKYYIEALHKEGASADHLSVGWQLPDGTLERPIPGNRLSPFGSSGSRIAADEEPADEEVEEVAPPEETAEIRPGLAFYPNPVDDVLHIDGVSDQTDLKVFNIQGIPVMLNHTSSDEGSIVVNTSSLSPGIYFLVLNTNEGVQKYKFVKQ